jgi:hypothetical protein
MDKNVLPGLYSTSLTNDDHSDIRTTYHPLKKPVKQNQLTVESAKPYNYRSRANSNIIERRFSNVEQPPQILEQVCKYKNINKHQQSNLRLCNYYLI